MDRYNWVYGGDNVESAREAAGKYGGTIYTQVDAGMTVAYERGECFVNRTGWYVVILPPRPSPA